MPEVRCAAPAAGEERWPWPWSWPWRTCAHSTAGQSGSPPAGGARPTTERWEVIRSLVTWWAVPLTWPRSTGTGIAGRRCGWLRWTWPANMAPTGPPTPIQSGGSSISSARGGPGCQSSRLGGVELEWRRGGPERGPLFVPAGTKMGPLQDKGEGQGLPLPLTAGRARQRWPWGSGPVPPPFAHPPGVGGKARGAPPSHKRRYRTGGCGGLRHLRGLCPRSAHASLPRKPPDPITGLMAPPALASYGVNIWVSAIWSGATPLSAPGHVAPWFCPRRTG